MYSSSHVLGEDEKGGERICVCNKLTSLVVFFLSVIAASLTPIGRQLICSVPGMWGRLVGKFFRGDPVLRNSWYGRYSSMWHLSIFLWPYVLDPLGWSGRKMTQVYPTSMTGQPSEPQVHKNALPHWSMKCRLFRHHSSLIPLSSLQMDMLTMLLDFLLDLQMGHKNSDS